MGAKVASFSLLVFSLLWDVLSWITWMLNIRSGKIPETVEVSQRSSWDIHRPMRHPLFRMINRSETVVDIIRHLSEVIGVDTHAHTYVLIIKYI